MRTLYCKIVWPVLLHVLSACAVPSVPARAFLSRAVPPAPGTRCPGHSAASRATWGAAGGRDQAGSVLLGALGGTGMLLSLVISLESQRLLVKAVTCPGTELPKCFQRQKRTCALSPSSNPASPSFPRGMQGWSVCNGSCVPGVTVKCPVPTALTSFGGIMEGLLFFQLLISLCPASLY